MFQKIFEMISEFVQLVSIDCPCMKVMTVDNGFEETAFENGREAFWQLEGRFFMRLHENHETSTFNLTQMNFRLGQDIVFNRLVFSRIHELLRPYQFNIRNKLFTLQFLTVMLSVPTN